VIDGQHHGARIVRIKDARQPVFHSPIERIASLDPARGALMRYVEVVVFSILQVVKISHG
jgi:hypothetical protein